MRLPLLVVISSAQTLFATGVCLAAETALSQPLQPLPATARLLSGRTLTGQFDPASHQGTLWILWNRPGISMRQPVPWQRVLELQVGGQTLSGERLDAFRAGLPNPPPPDDATADLRVAGQEVAESRVPVIRRRSVELARIESLSIEAELGHWDRSTGPDGLVVRVVPRDRQGRATAVRGTLELELVGTQWTSAPERWTFPTIARWTQAVDEADFRSGTAEYRLPFQGVHPESDLRLGLYGVVRARLAVPGEGVFEAAADSVRIRVASPVRDRLLHATGSRRFQGEP